MDYNDDFGVALKDKRKAYEIDHETFSQAQVEMLMKQDIDHISGICGVDVSVTLPLLCSLTTPLIGQHRHAIVVLHDLE